MLYKHKYFLIFICAIFLNACSSKTEEKKETKVTFDPNAQSTIQGTIKLAANLVADSDLNDMNTVSIDNSTFSKAQKIENFVTVQGFAAKVPTSKFEQNEGSDSERKADRFYSSTDEYDIYQAQLLAGQTLYLQTVDSDYYDSDDTFSGDLDLFIYNQNYELVTFSDNITEYDSVVVPDNGNYFISIHAFSGASKYVLRLLPNNTQSSQNLQVNNIDFVPNQLILQFKGQSSVNVKQTQAFRGASFKHTSPNRSTLVKFTDTRAASASSVNQAGAMSELASINHASYEKRMTLHKLKTTQSLPETQLASLNYIRSSQLTPSDTFYRYQWHYEKMNLPAAWDLTTGTPDSGEVIVAVIDTGIFANHPDLKNKIIAGYDFISDSENSGDDDADFQFSDIDDNPEDPGDGNDISSSSWHGTHVAGTIAAETNNSYGIAGVSWGAKIMPLRALGSFGGTSYDIMQAVRYAAGLENDSGTTPPQTADIINLSLGGPGSSSIEQAVFNEIHDLGIIVVAAAGNEASSQSFYPASYDDVISVSALDLNSNLAPYSNFGSTIDIAAPGGDMSRDNDRNGDIDGILSTLVEDANGRKNATFAYYQGTSMAAPHVSGMFALMKAVYPELNAETVDNLLANNLLTNDIGVIGKDNLYGFGSANALKAVQEAINLSENGTIPTVEFLMKSSPSSISFYNTTEAIISITNEGSGAAHVTNSSSNEDWLSVTYTDSQESGLGSYLVEADIEDLEPGTYTGELTFEFSSLESETVIPSITTTVYLTVTEFSSSSKIAELVVAVFDSETFDLVKTVNATYAEVNDGTVSFTLNRLLEGSYYLYAGTDIDYDGYICQYGEACAIYPSIGTLRPIDLADQSTIDVNLSAFILSPLNTLNKNTSTSTQKTSYEVNVQAIKPILKSEGLLIRQEDE